MVSAAIFRRRPQAQVLELMRSRRVHLLLSCLVVEHVAAPARRSLGLLALF